MPITERFLTANGWTVSFSDDTPPSLCSVAAWPTLASEDAPRDMSAWFDFGDGSRDRRCWSFADICEAVEMVVLAPPPEPAT